jgi:deoxycytidine triphosphate deaminase
VLATSELLGRLQRGEIFRPNSWVPENLHGAVYDLRIAEDGLIIPDLQKAGDRIPYHRGTARSNPVILRPGDVAFVTSAERFSVPWDLAGNIGVKFSFAKRGLLVHTGAFIQPGFGMRKDAGGAWIACEDERLHFFIANLNSADTSFSPGQDRIASVQFHHLSGDPDRQEVESGLKGEEELFSQKDRWQTLASIEKLEAAERKHVAEISKISGRQEAIEKRQDIAEGVSNYVLVFGVFLVAAALLGAVYTQIMSLLSSGEVRGWLQTLDKLSISTQTMVIVLALMLLVTVLLIVVLLVAVDLVKRVVKRQASPTSPRQN